MLRNCLAQLWLLLLLLSSSLLVVHALDEKECLLGDDGTCLSTSATNELSCHDNEQSCSFWASEGECDANPKYMLLQCPKSCSVCHVLDIQALIDQKLAPDIDATELGVPQIVDQDRALEVEARIQNITNYFQTIVKVQDEYQKVRKECKNRHESCAYWAVLGECEANPNYMQLQCAPSCYSCHLIDFDQRCPYDPKAPIILNPGDLDQLFVNITTSPEMAKYGPLIHSMPHPPKSSTIKAGPWVVTLENFLTDEECQTLIDLGSVEGYQISQDVGKRKFDGSYDGNINKGRTSTNAWCQNDCFQNSTTKQVLQKIEHLTGIPDENSEFLQLLKYEVGQFYQQHHDYIPHHLERSEGVRILTVFLYLNDVTAGGGTNFPLLDITVMPKRGRALIWPSVLNDAPNGPDHRTEHQALPVEEGVKYGANAWLHQKNFKEAFNRSCH